MGTVWNLTSAFMHLSAGECLAVSAEGQECLWEFLPPELLTDIARRVLQQPACASSLTGSRLACMLWRKIIDSAVEGIWVESNLYTSFNLEALDLRGLSLRTFTNIKYIHNLPSHCLCDLAPKTSLVSLSLTGTGTDREYAVLSQMLALQYLHLKGPVTLTSERLCMLGTQPQLRCLKFDRILFPRTPYADHAYKSAPFQYLQTLVLLGQRPLTGHGSVGTDVGTAGQQFLRTLQSLKRLTIHVDAGCQVLFETLGILPKLQEVNLLHGISGKGKHMNWALWSWQTKCIKVYCVQDSSA